MSTASTVIPPPPPPPPPPHPPLPQGNGTAEAPEEPSRGTKSTMATIKLMFCSDFRNGEPNPVHVAISTRGYDIQSRVLRIPDRYGFFTRGSPLRSAFEGHALVYGIFYLVLVAVAFSACVAGLEATGHHSLELPIAFAVIYIMIIVTFWAVMVHSPRRKLDYYWGDNPELPELLRLA